MKIKFRESDYITCKEFNCLKQIHIDKGVHDEKYFKCDKHFDGGEMYYDDKKSKKTIGGVFKEG